MIRCSPAGGRPSHRLAPVCSSRRSAPPASAVDAGGGLEIGGCVELAQVEPQQKAAQVRFPGVGARSSVLSRA